MASLFSSASPIQIVSIPSPVLYFPCKTNIRSYREGERVTMSQVELPDIGLYTPVRSLGEGSTTFRHLYRYEQRKKYVVIKITHAPLVTLAEKEAFMARTRLLKKLKHRNMSEVVDAGLLQAGEPADDYGYLVVQYIEGSAIRERFVPGQCYAPDEVRAVLFPLADTLQYAHKMFAIHGNLHPGNILQAGKEVFLTDFSLPTQTSPLPDPQAMLYRAPEHLRDTASPAPELAKSNNAVPTQQAQEQPKVPTKTKKLPTTSTQPASVLPVQTATRDEAKQPITAGATLADLARQAVTAEPINEPTIKITPRPRPVQKQPAQA